MISIKWCLLIYFFFFGLPFGFFADDASANFVAGFPFVDLVDCLVGCGDAFVNDLVSMTVFSLKAFAPDAPDAADAPDAGSDAAHAVFGDKEKGTGDTCDLCVACGATCVKGVTNEEDNGDFLNVGGELEGDGTRDVVGV